MRTKVRIINNYSRHSFDIGEYVYICYKDEDGFHCNRYDEDWIEIENSKHPHYLDCWVINEKDFEEVE